MLQIHTEGRVNRHCWDLLLFLKIYNLKKRTDLNYSTYRLAEKRRDSISSRDQQGENLYKRSLSHLLLVWRTLQFFRREESTTLYYIWNKYLFMIHSYQNKWQAFLYNTGIDMILKFHSWNIYLENHTTSALHLEKFLFVLFFVYFILGNKAIYIYWTPEDTDWRTFVWRNCLHFERGLPWKKCISFCKL